MLCYAADLLNCAIEHHFPRPTSVGANVNTARSCSVEISFDLYLRKLENNVRTTVSQVAIKMAFLLLPGFNGDLLQVSSL